MLDCVQFGKIFLQILKNCFDSPLPLEGESLEVVYSEFLEKILPYPNGNIHPRFWGWALGTGTITGALAEFLASSMNSNMGGGNHGAILVERQVINWIKEMVNFSLLIKWLIDQWMFIRKSNWLTCC